MPEQEFVSRSQALKKQDKNENLKKSYKNLFIKKIKNFIPKSQTQPNIKNNMMFLYA